MRVKLPVKQCACACLLGMVASANLATASGLQIAPVTLTLQATQNADGIWLSNAGENVLNAQVRVFRWSQSAYDNKLSPSQGLVISPPMLALAPGERQLIRVIRTSPPSAHAEDAYRLSIDELPPAKVEKINFSLCCIIPFPFSFNQHQRHKRRQNCNGNYNNWMAKNLLKSVIREMGMHSYLLQHL